MGLSSTTVAPLRVMVPFIVPPAEIGIVSLVKPAGTLTVVEVVGDVASVTDEGAVVNTTAQMASCGYGVRFQPCSYAKQFAKELTSWKLSGCPTGSGACAELECGRDHM